MPLRPSIHEIRSLPNFTQLFRWGVVISSPPNAIAYPGDNAISFRASSTTYPKLTPNVTPITIRGSKVNEVGRGVYSDNIVLTLFETVDMIITQFIHDWTNACWSLTDGGQTGISQNKEDVEAVIQLFQLNNFDEPIWCYELHGVLLSDYEPGGDGGEEEDTPMKPAMTLSYDYYKGFKP